MYVWNLHMWNSSDEDDVMVGTGFDGVNNSANEKFKSERNKPCWSRRLRGSPEICMMWSGIFRRGCLQCYVQMELLRCGGSFKLDNECVADVLRYSFIRRATWLILPVVICLSQRLSHACLSISSYTVKLRMAHYNSYCPSDHVLYMDTYGNSRANTCIQTRLRKGCAYWILHHLS